MAAAFYYVPLADGANEAGRIWSNAMAIRKDEP